MGYLTTYTLEIIDAGTHSLNEIFGYMHREWSAKDIMNLYDEDSHRIEESIKWYEHDADMFELSSKYPTAIFKLHGEGETAGDYWTTWYCNSKSHTWQPNLIEPVFDPNWFK